VSHFGSNSDPKHFRSRRVCATRHVYAIVTECGKAAVRVSVCVILCVCILCSYDVLRTHRHKKPDKGLRMCHRTHTHVHPPPPQHTQTHTWRETGTRTDTLTDKDIHTHTHTHTHTHSHTHTHTHTPAQTHTNTNAHTQRHT